MRSPSGGQWSFKKNGRIDAALFGVEGTNVIVMCLADGKQRVIPVASLSEDDRAYLKRANGVSEGEAVSINQAAAAKSAEAAREAEVIRLKAEAASKRRVARLDIQDALRLENDARRLGSRASSLEFQGDHRARVADTIESSAVVPPKVGFAYVNARASQGLKTGAADRLETELVGLSQQAADKRAHAATLEQEAADLEARVRWMQSGADLRSPVSR